jgi:hypothetical protein
MFERDRLRYITSKCHRCFYLPIQVGLVYILIFIIDRMIIWITVLWISIGILILLDLDRCNYPLLTEGYFIPSGTASDNLWYQSGLIIVDNAA